MKRKTAALLAGAGTLVLLAVFVTTFDLTESSSMSTGKPENDKNRKPNHLVNETSPYLLQHAYNPVEWYPWGSEAFERAEKEGKPVLVSIGYSSCHWCHVMEEKVFENDSIAALMNQHLINIKVDREERPDIDKIYMDYVQMTTGSGGWPLNVFMTPDKKPFFAGTYFPPERQYGRPSFADVVVGIAESFKTKKQDIEKHVAQVLEAMKAENLFSGGKNSVETSILDQSFEALKSRADMANGGFGGAPKFPPAMNLMFLLRYHKKNNSEEALELVRLSLQKMATGGIFDHLAGGFHRYSVDDAWQVPHFEKMLYDNALLSRVYLEAYQLTGDRDFASVAIRTLDFVSKEMMSPEGGFYSAIDADSEGEEGKFYVWKSEEIEKGVDSEDYEIVRDYYGVSAAGNFETETNILHVADDVASLAKRFSKTEDEILMIVERSRERLLEIRSKRERPFTDRKIITSWNSMMLSSFALASQVLDREDYLEIAQKNAEFMESHLAKKGEVLRIFNDGRSKIDGFLDDYSALAEGYLNLYEASFEEQWLKRSIEIADSMVAEFWDSKTGSFFFTSGDHEELIIRSKEIMDNATPSGNSMAINTILRLGLITGNDLYHNIGRQALESLAGFIPRAATAFGYVSLGLDFYLDRPKEIVIVGEADERETRAFISALRERFLPNKVVLLKTLTSSLEGLSPLAEGKTKLDGKAAAYVCQDYVCKQPARDVETFKEQLN